jgi:MerR family transcriptional regulator, copper efflux regulator
MVAVVVTGLKIRDVAEASGFTTAALRYYEQIGLLPEASRTPAGYRLYDSHTLDLLAFIARAKQLGCTLEEITDLTVAWNGGECGPVQDELRRLVAEKIVAAQNQIAELATFTSELQQAATALERHRPEGACNSVCGCVSDPTDSAQPAAAVQTVMLSTKAVVPGQPAIACTLAAGSMKGHLADWQALLAHGGHRERIDGGIRVVFASSVPTGELIGLVAAEQSCCQFFQFAITVDARGVALEVRAPADAQLIVESLFGAAS